MFGFASSGAAYDVAWSSSDPSTVTVINGELQAWKLGSAVITANKNGYTAPCRASGSSGLPDCLGSASTSEASWLRSLLRISHSI